MPTKVKWGGLRLLVLAASVLSVTVFSGCSSDDDSSGTPVLTPAEQVEQGWTFFETGEYAKALAEFKAALAKDGTLADAQNGIGWTLGRIPDSLSHAPQWFDRSLRQDTTRYDALGGWAFAVYQLGEWQTAIDKSDYLLRRRPGWRFLHEPTLDETDIRLMQAGANYYLGNYSASLDLVVAHLNSAFEADVSTPTGRRELLDEIERLRRVYG